MTDRQDLLVKKFGNTLIPRKRSDFEKKWMINWHAPIEALELNPLFPKKIYVNKLIVPYLDAAVKLLIATGLIKEITSFGGCFNPRLQRGSTNRISIHSWGLAFDFNVAENPLVSVPKGMRLELRKKFVKWSEKFLDCWRTAGFDCGADWKNTLDGMHFELVNPFLP